MTTYSNKGTDLWGLSAQACIHIESALCQKASWLPEKLLPFALTNRMCYFPEGNQFPLQRCKYSESSEQHAVGLCRQCDVRHTQLSSSLCWQAAYGCQRMATLESAGLPRMCVGLLCKAQNLDLWVSRSFFPF